MSAAAKAAADLAAVLPADDMLAQVARMTLEHMVRVDERSRPSFQPGATHA